MATCRKCGRLLYGIASTDGYCYHCRTIHPPEPEGTKVTTLASSQTHIAQAIATIAHLGQTDKAGNPYIEHPRAVASILNAQGHSDHVIAAGWLHDVLEDTAVTAEDLAACGVSWSVITYVQAVTRIEGESAETYYSKVKSSTGGMLVKLADIENNTDPKRLALIEDDATILRLIKKYAKALNLLEAPIKDDLLG